MSPLYSLLVSFFLSLLVVSWIHPRLVKIALLKNIVDNPDARKLQRTPVPVLGGVAVFSGIVIGIGSVESAVNSSGLLIVIMAMMAMLYTGTMDDILNLSPALRFLIEILVVLLLIHAGGYCIDDFHGLWGIGRIPRWIAVPLTVVASVGIINAINLIDGVNGLSSGYCITACTMFGTLFYLSGDMKMTILAAVSVGALIPFFLHNVFGKTSKMFIGDGGTLVMGVVITVFVIETLRSGSSCGAYVEPRVGLVPFSLAVLCIPVFDTLRVMFSRILRGVSPFRPDKTHLHHMFINLGCSHAAVTLAITNGTSAIENVVGTILSPIRAGVASIDRLAERYYNYMFRYETLEAKNAEMEKQILAMQEDIRTDVDFVLTYEELMGIFEAKEINFSTLPDSPDLDEGTRAGRGFAVAVVLLEGTGNNARALRDIVKNAVALLGGGNQSGALFGKLCGFLLQRVNLCGGHSVAALFDLLLDSRKAGFDFFNSHCVKPPSLV